MTLRLTTSDPLVLLRNTESDPIPAGAEDRVLARLNASMAAISAQGAVLGAKVSAGNVAATPRWLEIKRIAVWTAPSLMVGALAGTAIHAAFTTERMKTTYVDPAGEKAPEPAVQAPVSSPSGPAKEQEAPPPAVVISTPVKSSAAASELSKERALLDRARAKMAEGEAQQALSLLERHAHLHARGTLIEEREAMAVNALVSLGRYADAKKRGASFRERFSGSLVLLSVEAALAAIPPE
jgi:hypothetical protein